MLCFVAFVALAPQVLARADYDQDGNPTTLTVAVGKKVYFAEPDFGSDGPGAFSDKVGFGGRTVVAQGTNLVDGKGGSKIDLRPISKKLFGDAPAGYPLALESKGGILVGDWALWVYAWDNLETMGEPAAYTFIVKLQRGPKGELETAGSAPLAGLGAHIRRVVGRRYAGRIAIVGEGISLFNFDTMKEEVALTDGHGVVAPSGHVYWNARGALSLYDEKSGKFLHRASHDLGYLSDAFTVDGVDVLAFHLGLFVPTERATYRFPGPDNGGGPQPYYVVPGVGIGFLDKYAFPADTPGILLSAEHLAPVAMIRRAR